MPRTGLDREVQGVGYGYGAVNATNVTPPPGSVFPTATGPEASRQAASQNGNLYFPNDGFGVDRDTGTVWSTWGPLYPFVFPPLDGAWAWVNQAGGTTTQTNQGIYLDGGITISTQNIQIRKRTIGAFTTLIAAFMPTLVVNVNGNCGLILRESSTGKLQTFSVIQNANWNVSIFNCPTPTTFTATTLSGAGALFPPVRFRIIIGASITFYYGNDGQHWVPLITVAKTNAFTVGPDEWGFYVDGRSTVSPSGINLLSWSEA